jgi:hypothetical protein
MSDNTPEIPKTAARRKRSPRVKKARLAGEVTYIEVPRPDASAFNPGRPVNALLMAQLEHLHHAEKNRLPRHKVSRTDLSGIHNEGEAAAYIKKVTAMLHPEGKKRNRKKTSKPS